MAAIGLPVKKFAKHPYGSSDEDAKQKLQYDLYYIKNYSLFLDIAIMIQTAQVILWGKGR